jgi:hypothetical protein
LRQPTETPDEAGSATSEAADGRAK